MLCLITCDEDAPYTDVIPGVRWWVSPYEHVGALVFEFTHRSLTASLLTRVIGTGAPTPFIHIPWEDVGDVGQRWHISRATFDPLLFTGLDPEMMQRAEIRVDLHDDVDNRPDSNQRIYIESYPPHKHWVLWEGSAIYMRLEDGWEIPASSDRPTSWDRITREDGTEVVRPGVG